VKKLPVCANCGSMTGIRRILWGMPKGEPDPAEFVIGGCTPGANPATLRCNECGWENDQPRWKRFVSESLDGIRILCHSCNEWFEAKDWTRDHLCKSDGVTKSDQESL
jgi:hypothetical protein